ncbi:MAG: hypothetical protein HY303_04505 [Candidatus Wallbacteria bacterium]|nr:hypothetical protein [Candidatus Wallbacteria bacterium]
MIRRIGLALLFTALLAPVALLAKGYAPPSRERQAPTGLEEGLLSQEPVDTTSQEVTEVVTSESIPLPPVVEPAKAPSPDDLNGYFGLRDGHKFPSEWAAFWRLSGYNPNGNRPSDGSLLSNLGLRYKTPDRWGEYYQLAYEAAYNFWNGSNADVQVIELDVEVFAAGSSVFRLKHHPYYGIGFGNATVNRQGSAAISENVFSVFGGVEFPGRRVDFDVFAKYYYGPNAAYNLDDLQIGLGVVYTFGRGR